MNRLEDAVKEVGVCFVLCIDAFSLQLLETPSSYEVRFLTSFGTVALCDFGCPVLSTVPGTEPFSK